MHRLIAAIALTSFSIGSGAIAQAADSSENSASATSIVGLSTSPLYADNGQSYHACNIANITKSAVLITASIIKSDGTVLKASGNVTLAAGTSVEISLFTGYTGFARCSFTVKGATSYVRANETVFHNTGSYYEAIAFSEAR